MNTLIVYATKSGASGECAQLLRGQIENCTLYDLGKEQVDISGFDTIIIGSGVRIGKIYKPAKAFIKQNLAALLNKKIAFYLCNAYPGTFEKAVEKNIPRSLKENAFCLETLGGKPPFTSPATQDWLYKSNLNHLVEAIKQANGVT